MGAVLTVAFSISTEGFPTGRADIIGHVLPLCFNQVLIPPAVTAVVRTEFLFLPAWKLGNQCSAVFTWLLRDGIAGFFRSICTRPSKPIPVAVGFYRPFAQAQSLGYLFLANAVPAHFCNPALFLIRHVPTSQWLSCEGSPFIGYVAKGADFPVWA